MTFHILAFDHEDADALDRRMAARAAHLEGARAAEAAGTLKFGGAFLSADGRMIGSAMVMEAADEAELLTRLHADPYWTGRVWSRFEIRPYRLAIPAQK